MAKTMVPFGEWRPDTAYLDTQFASEAKNVLARINSYDPFYGLTQFAQGTSMALASAGNDSSTKILLHFNGTDGGTTILDENAGGSAHTWTAAGNANTDNAQFKFGPTSLACDGTGDWVTTPDHADFTLGSGDWTFDCWFNCNAAGGSNLYIAGQTDNALTATTISFTLRRDTTNVIVGVVNVSSTSSTVTGTTQFTNAVNTGWHHVALVRTGSAIRLFIDGTQEGSDAAISGTVNDSASVFGVGIAGALASNGWNGWLDEARLSVGSARWTTTFTPKTVPYFEGGACRGLFVARHPTTATDIVFAGTAKKLLYGSTDGIWQDVSRISGGNYSLASTDYWSFEQSGTNVVAVNVSDAPQVIDLTTLVASSAQFAALGGSPPNAANVKQIGDFLVLSGLSSNNRKISWSAVSDITGWTVGTSLSDEQTFPEGAEVMGVLGGETGLVVQRRKIRSMQFLPGDTDRIFAFSAIENRRGSQSRYGMVHINGTLFFIAEDGFYSFGANGLVPIGDQKINKWFSDNGDGARRTEAVAFTLAAKQRVVWAFYNTSGSTSFDRLLIYDWVSGYWSYAVISAQMWATAPGAGQTIFAYAVDTSGVLCSNTSGGSALEALLETAEIHPVPGQRAFVNEAYPIVDVSSATVLTGTRERQADSVTYGSAVSMETNGTVPILKSSRLFRFRVTVPAAATWTHAQGVMIDAQPDGNA